MRQEWIERRLEKSDGNNSQMHLARKGEITEEMQYVAAREDLSPTRGRKGARDHDDALSKARFNFEWEKQFALSLDPETARNMHDEELPDEAFKDTKFCSMRITQIMREYQDGDRVYAPKEDALLPMA